MTKPTNIPSIPSIPKIERFLGRKAQTWKGECGLLAEVVQKMMGKKAKATIHDGRYFGPVRKGTIFDVEFGDIHKQTGFMLHTWCECDGWIIDPTRWVFDGRKPYVFVAKRDKRLSKQYKYGQ